MAYDVVLKGGTVIDGTGRERFAADIALSGDRIAAVEANIPSHEAASSIDIGGLIVCPGFIDHHTHYDAQILWDPAGNVFVLARSDFHYHGQLWGRSCAVQACRPGSPGG